MPQQTSHNHFLHVALELLEFGDETDFFPKKFGRYLLLCASGYVTTWHAVINIDNNIPTPNSREGNQGDFLTFKIWTNFPFVFQMPGYLLLLPPAGLQHEEIGALARSVQHWWLNQSARFPSLRSLCHLGIGANLSASISSPCSWQVAEL